MRAVEQAVAPQTETATRMVAWLSGGLVRPTGDDFAMVRLFLLALLPQIGGVLLMIGRTMTATSARYCVALISLNRLPLA